VGVASAGGGPGTPHSLPENSTSLSGGPGSNPGNNDSKSDNLQNNQNSTLNGGTGVNQSASNNDGLHCDSNNPTDQPGGGGGPQGGPGGGQGDNNGPNQGHPDGLSGSADQNSNNEGAQIKQEDVKPNALNSGTPGGMGPGGQQNNTSSVLPPEFDGLGDFPPDSKDGVKDEPDDSDNLAALTDFKEEDLKEFDNAVNDFSNGKHDLFYLISLITWVLIFCLEFRELSPFQLP
jgi:hypothetical protein